MKQEEELALLAAQGDADAAESLVRLLYPDILRYCSWRLPSRSLAEDAAQETFLKLLRYFSRYTGRGKFRSFLYKIAANTCTDILRSRRELSLEALEEEPTYQEPGFEKAWADAELRRSVRCLPPEQQEVILLRFGQELTLREIAEVQGVPLRTAQSRLRSALRTLKKTYAEGEIP